MKSLALIAAAGMLAAAAPASATDFDWSWLDQTTDTLVQGTLFNLTEGYQSLATGDVNVTFSTYGSLIDSDASHFQFVGGDATVSGGHITSLSGFWQNAANGSLLWLGTNPGCCTAYPELASGDSSINQYNCCQGNPMTFEARSAVPEPAAWALMLVGFGTIGAAMRRRRVTVRFA